MVDPPQDMFTDLKKVCDVVGVDFADAERDLIDFVGAEPVIGYYLTTAPSPYSKDLLVDIFVLTSQCLYNHEICSGFKACYALFLNHICRLREQPEEANKELISLHFEMVGRDSLVLVDTISKGEEVRRFCQKVRDATIDKQRTAK